MNYVQLAIAKLKSEIELTEWDISSSEEIILENEVPFNERRELIEYVALLKNRLKDYKQALALLEKYN